MRLFGILLIIGNLLAGAGFVYLSTQDWKGRQSITAAGLRFVLLLKGVPLDPTGPDGFNADDETSFVVEMGGGETTKTISKKLLEAYFRDNSGSSQATAGPDAGAASRVPLAVNTPVTNQIAEVKRVQTIIKGELAKDGAAPAEKLSLLRGWLLYQAENYETRLEYLALTDLKDAKGQAKTPEQLKADTDRLEKILDARFAAVINKPDANRTPTPAALPDIKKVADELTKLTDDLRELRDRRPAAPEDDIRAKVKEVDAKRAELADTGKQAQGAADQVADKRGESSLDETERRLRLAHLLVHLDPDPAWQKRIIAVVGLRRYVRAVSLQVLRFDDMIRHVEQAIPGDQSVFIVEETALRQQATQQAERARAVAEERAKLVEQKTATDDAANRGRTQLKNLTDQLTKVKAEVDELLVQQAKVEKQLFELQREVSLTLEDVYRLEAMLDAAERERFGIPPRP